MMERMIRMMEGNVDTPLSLTEPGLVNINFTLQYVYLCTSCARKIKQLLQPSII